VQKNKLIVVPPAVESLLAVGTGESMWPSIIQDNPEIRSQAEMRRILFKKLDLLFRQIPKATTEIAEAIDSGKINPETVAEIYELMADFLDADPYHRYLVLYLPFELLPNRTRQPLSDKFEASAHRLIRSYLACWHELLKENNVRANFSDGDILEPELSPNGQVMVCKAAHLIPKLVQKGIISAEYVLDLLDKSTNDILRDSITDVLPVLADMSLLSGYNFPTQPQTKLITNRLTERGANWLRKLPADSEFELQKLDMRAATDQFRNMPKLRISWERQDRQNKLIDKYADEISAMMAEGSLSAWDISKFLASKPDTIPCLAVINGVRKFLELTASNDPDKAAAIFVSYNHVMKLWNNRPEIKESLTSMMLRLANLGIVDEEYLGNYKIRLPRPDAPVLKGEHLVKEEIKYLEPKIAFIAKEDEVSELIYPIVLLFGSRLKGYARTNADLDIGIFVRPGISQNKRSEIKKMLSKIFRSKRIDGKIVEFWLEEENSKLRIRNFIDPDVSLADDTWAHLLFASIWLGKEDAIKELYTKLLLEFIFSKGKTLEGQDARVIWLGEMERDVLQYRLMHKGYRRLYSEQGGICAEHSQNLDSQSSFWDSGYRRLAAKLFITRVFLPRL